MGNKLKHEIKAHTLFELGQKLDDQLEAAQREQSGYDGAKNALTTAKTLVEGLSVNVDREIKDGTLDLDQSVLIKRWISRCAAVVQNLGIQAEVQNYQAQGKIMALRHTVKVTKSLYDTEKAGLEEALKAEQGIIEEEIDPRRPDARVSGQHPGNPLADRREETSEAPAEPEPATASEPPPDSEEAPPEGETSAEGEESPETVPAKKSTSKPPPKKKAKRW